MADSDITVGQLKNSQIRADKTAFLRKVFKNRLYATSKQYTVLKQDTTGYFRFDYSELDGTDVLWDYSTPLPEEDLIFNDNDSYVNLFTCPSYFETTDWIFDYTNGELTTTINDLVSKDVAKDSSRNFTEVTNTITNYPTNFLTNYSLVIVNATEELSSDWNDTLTITGCESFYFKIKNNNVGETLPMFNQEGVLIILTLRYS